MKYLFLSILMIGVGIGLVGCEDDDKDDPAVEEEVIEDDSDAPEKDELYDYEINGVVEAGDSDTGGDEFYGIFGDDGVRYDPRDSLPDEFKIGGLEVYVLANDVGENNSVEVVIDIVEIRVR